MNIKEAYVCPKCNDSATKPPVVHGIQAIMEDIRYDILQCPDCKTVWRVYYKVSDVSTEVTHVVSEESSEDTPTTEAQ